VPDVRLKSLVTLKYEPRIACPPDLFTVKLYSSLPDILPPGLNETSFVPNKLTVVGFAVEFIVPEFV